MRPEAVGEFVNAAMMFTIGLSVTLVGYRVLGKKPGQNFQNDEWHRKYGKGFQVTGPLLALCGLALMLKAVLRPG